MRHHAIASPAGNFPRRAVPMSSVAPPLTVGATLSGRGPIDLSTWPCPTGVLCAAEASAHLFRDSRPSGGGLPARRPTTFGASVHPEAHAAARRHDPTSESPVHVITTKEQM